MNERRTIAVAGATGFVGRHAVRELLARGYSVRGLVRDREKSAKVLPRDERLRLIQGDVLDATSLAGLTAGAAACVNAIGLLRETGGQTFRKAHVDSTRALVGACREAGVPRFIQVSALGVSGHGATPYQKTKWEAEHLVAKSDLAWTILRPGLIHGPDGGVMAIAKGWVTGHRPPWFFLPYFARGVKSSDVPLAALRREPATVAPVAIEDVAWAIAECLDRPDTIGETFNLVGPEELTWPEMLRAIRDAVPGANPALEPLGIPSELAAMKARAAGAIGLGGLLPFDEGMARMGAADSTATLDKARAQLGFDPRPFRAALKSYAARIA